MDVKIRVYFGILLAVLCVFYNPVSLIAEETPTNYDAFDGRLVGARAIGMGGAFVSIADNADATFWNPAGLVYIPRNLFSATFEITRDSEFDVLDIMEAEPLQGKKLNFISFAGKQGGFFWRPLTNYQQKTEVEVDGVTTKEELELKVNEFGLSVAVPYEEGVSWGANIKYFNGRLGLAREESVGGSKKDVSVNLSDGNGWGLDWAFIYRVKPELSIGLNLQNAPAYIYWDDYSRDKMPPIFRVGFGMKMTDLLTFASDFEQRFYRKARPDGERRIKIYRLGLEQILMKRICLRGGIWSEDLDEKDLTTYTLGIGYSHENHYLDLCMKRYIAQLEGEEEPVYEYIVSVGLPF